MKKNLRFKVLGVFLAGIVLSMFVLTFLSNALLKPVFIQNSKNIMKDSAEKIEVCLSETPDETVKMLEEVNISYGVTTHVVNENGKIIHSYTKLRINKNLEEKYKKYIGYYNSIEDNNEYYFKQRTDESDAIKKIVYIDKISDGLYIIMNKAVKGIEQDIRIVSMFIMIMGFTVAVFGTVVWGFFTKNFTDNIKKMSRITRSISKLDFSEKINHNSNDELGDLAHSIDVLSVELESSIEDLKADIERHKRLIRDISHELKTPVTTVKGYIENIEALSGDNEIFRKYCKIASEECDEINDLVEEMLEMSRLESQGYVCDMENIDVELIKKSILGKLSAEFCEYKFDVEFESAFIYCNSVLITRAVMNYVKNAVKYGEEGSVIIINGSVADGYYTFSVANKGKPISDEEKENIWELFYKNDRSRQRNESHGIGLSMVRQIAVLHKGCVNLTVESTENIFSIKIPVQ